MGIVDIKLSPKQTAIVVGVVLLLGLGVWKYISIQSKLTTALESNTAYEKRVSVCESNYSGIDSSLEKLKTQMEELETRNKGLVDAVTLSGKRVNLIKTNYDALLQKVERSPTECKEAMKWLRSQPR